MTLVAEAVMSTDNVVAVAAIADGDVAMLILGLTLSIPLIVYGGVALSAPGRGFPMLTVGVAGLVARIGGSLIGGDPVIAGWIAHQAPAVAIMAPLAAAIFVLAEGRPPAPAPSAKTLAERSPAALPFDPPARGRAAAGFLRERRAPPQTWTPVDPGRAAIEVGRGQGSDESEKCEPQSADERFVLLGFLSLFLVVGRIVLWAIVAGGGVLDARG